jgi:hypothetical protein
MACDSWLVMHGLITGLITITGFWWVLEVVEVVGGFLMLDGSAAHRSMVDGERKAAGKAAGSPAAAAGMQVARSTQHALRVTCAPRPRER